MEGKVVNMTKYRPHLSGNARCLQCSHEWVAVTPIGTTELECPECKTLKGVMKGLVAPQTVWECACGSQLFFIDPQGTMCSMCGSRPDPEEL
ncbi:hypothetical protein A3765_28560 [Oleiphilus sp. HI0130]|nr:hypothetical protein A3765_28845 [Oleiphilus sp. HI0130]KZZ72505.1 hypothetical protein A3765_28560 [Oleiphilus sp. HI0130]